MSGSLAGRVPDWLGRRAWADADRPALIFDDKRWTFAELHRSVGAAAAELADRGVRRGDRVALLARNGPEFAVAVHAVGRLGAVLVPLNVRLRPGEIAWQLGDSGASWLLHDRNCREQADAAVELQSNLASVELSPDWDDHGREPVAAPDFIPLEDVESIVYTSGTTGRPKGALITFGNLWASATAAALHLGHQHDDRWLATLPLFHVGGLAILFRGVIAAIPVVVQDGFDPALVNRTIDEERISLVSVVANMLRRMLDERGDRPYPPSLRCVLLGGGPAPRPLLERCLALGMPVAPTYGLTESASQAATLMSDDLAAHLGSAGKALPLTEIRIERDGAPAAIGEPGEIAIRGATVIPAYLGRVAARPDGWFATGDVGRIDADGYLYVLDRREDLIVSGGENVYPAEVEAVLLAHPAVEEAAVVGVADERWGAVPVAVVKLRDRMTVSDADLVDFCAARLAGYKRPRRIVRVPGLPRNAGGKLLRRELRGWLEAQPGDTRPDDA